MRRTAELRKVTAYVNDGTPKGPYTIDFKEAHEYIRTWRKLLEADARAKNADHFLYATWEFKEDTLDEINIYYAGACDDAGLAEWDARLRKDKDLVTYAMHKGRDY